MDKLFDISDGLETALGELTKARSALSMAAFELDSNATAAANDGPSVAEHFLRKNMPDYVNVFFLALESIDKVKAGIEREHERLCALSKASRGGNEAAPKAEAAAATYAFSAALMEKQKLNVMQ